VVFLKTFNTEPKSRRQVRMKIIKFIGLDVHKKTIVIAIAAQNDEVRLYGTIENNIEAINKVIRKLISDGSELSFVYEAGPCGYQLYRHLTGNGLDCTVVAPSLIPRKSGDRIKTDRRDAIALARLHRAGELTAVHVPLPEDEAIRDLSRAREDARFALRKAKQQLSAFLLRSGHIYSGRSHWSKAHCNWIAEIKMEHPGQQVVLQEYIDAVSMCSSRVDRITEQMRQLVAEWRLAPVVGALQALRGVSLIVAATTVAELGDLSRFKHPAKLMAFLGLVPSEHSSGETTKRGSITKAGNGHVRRALVEAAQAYRYPARRTRIIAKRQENLPEKIRALAWDAQLRLCGRFRRLSGRGKNTNVVVTAIARELIAFMWAIAKEVPYAA
jgi:transposase